MIGQLADRDVVTQLYRFVFQRPKEHLMEARPQVDNVSAVEMQTTEFASKVPECEYSPAEIMSYLLQHRNLPVVAVENVEKWMTTMSKDKTRMKLKREGSWNGCA